MKAANKFWRLAVVGLMVVCSLALLITGCTKAQVSSNSTQTTVDKVIELKFNSMYPSTHIMDRPNQYLAEQINKRTNGRVKITIYPSGTLTTPDKIYEGIVTGISDLGVYNSAYTPGRFPAADGFHVFSAAETSWVVSHVGFDYWNHFQPEENNDVHLLYYGGVGTNCLGSNTPILNPSALKGLKVRASGSIAVDYVNALGGTPIAMPMAEVYDGAKKGVIDVLLTNFEAYKAYKLAEVVKYVTVLPYSFASSSAIAMNKDTWNSLPSDIQKIFTDLQSEMVNAIGTGWWYGDIAGKEFFTSLGDGREIYEVSSQDASTWETLLKPVVDKYISEKTAMGLPAAEYTAYAQERAAYWNQHQIDEAACIKNYEEMLSK